jgi:hypothetical protein
MRELVQPRLAKDPRVTSKTAVAFSARLILHFRSSLEFSNDEVNGSPPHLAVDRTMDISGSCEAADKLVLSAEARLVSPIAWKT